MDLIKPGSKIDFVGNLKKGVVISWVLILIGMVSLIYHKGPHWGVEFVGGTEVHMKFTQDIKPDDIRGVLESAGYPAESVQQLGLAQDREYLLRFSPDVVTFDKIKVFQQKLEGIFKGDSKLMGASILRIDYIGPKVGRELIEKAIISVLLGCVGILLYLKIRFEWEFAMGAVVGIFHDVLITLGALSLMDKEFTLTIIAALLTVIGYSVNDTIVIFDRIRENMGRATKTGFRQLVNESINQTLSRTIVTGISTICVLLALFLLGGSVIHDFAFTLLVGVVVGTYSSIFVASAFVVYWRHRKGVLT